MTGKKAPTAKSTPHAGTEPGRKAAAGSRRGRPPNDGVAVALDEELARISSEETAAVKRELDPRQHAAVVREILGVFFNIWIRFAVDLGKELRMSPWQWDFINYEGGKQYRFRESFNFERVRDMSIEETGFPFRHALKSEFRTVAGRQYVRVSIVLEEGREFGRTGAVTASNSYIIYNELARKFAVSELKRSLGAFLRVWFRSEVRGEPALLWDFCHEKLLRGN
jgi:hypothetical protein